MTAGTSCATQDAGWPLQRILFLLAGAVTLTGVALTALVSPWFLLVPTVVGTNQLLMVATGWCPASIVLTRLGVSDLRNRSRI